MTVIVFFFFNINIQGDERSLETDKYIKIKIVSLIEIIQH